jgi:two-component system OmpR family response regulator
MGAKGEPARREVKMMNKLEAPLARISPLAADNGHVRVLLVEDDIALAEEITADLVSRGYRVVHRDTGPGGLECLQRDIFTLMIVDRMLPGMDGLLIVQQMREEKIRIPVLVLSALTAVDDRIRGLKAGGDDYLTKPFALEELAARIEALLRRPIETREAVLRAGPMEMNFIDRTVRRGAREIELLPIEFKLLDYLMRRPGQVVTRAMLLEDVWHFRFVPQTNVVDVHIGKLRRKVDPPPDAPLIQSIRSAGFMFRVPD